jgi:A/G-specific adenine glycosylase
LRELPGVGRYTAGALASIAFDQPEAIVDGNVVRVLSRVLGIREDVGGSVVQEQLWSEAGALARGPRPGDLNQALMELGATCCTPRSPRCDACPLARSCDANRIGDAELLPIKAKKKKPRPIAATAAWLPRRGTLLAVKRPSSGLLADMWELPGGDLATGAEPMEDLKRTLRENVGLTVSGVETMGEVEHVFTHLRLRLHVFRCKAVKGRLRLTRHAEHRWIKPDGFAELPHAAVTRKALDLLRS